MMRFKGMVPDVRRTIGPGVATPASAPMPASPAPGVPSSAMMGRATPDPRMGRDSGELGMPWDQRFRNVPQR